MIDKIYKLFIDGAAVCTDTRKIIPGSIFFALKGPAFNGNLFASQALQNGARAVVIDEPVMDNNENVFLTEDVLATLQQLGHHHRRQLNIPFLAITGSNGKTTTKELVNRVLSKKYKTLCTVGNLNNHIGVPLTLLSVTKNHELAVIEMGANHQGEIELLCAITEPTHVLITNVGKAHLEGFGGFEGVKKGKGEMFAFARKNNSHVFLNDDSPDLKNMLGDYYMITRYGTSDHCDVQGKVIPASTYVSLEWKEKNNSEWIPVNSKITGHYNFENILSAICAGVHFGVATHDITAAIESYIPDNQRSQEIIKGTNRIILDAYNANPTSMKAALENFSKSFTGKKIVFLGDMFELGEASAKEHEAIAQLASSLHFDKIILVGPEFKKTSPLENGIYLLSSVDAREWLKENPLSDYTILVKGSRSSKMEVVMDSF